MTRRARAALLPSLVVLPLACAEPGLAPAERGAARCRAAIGYGADGGTGSGAGAPSALRWVVISDSAGMPVLDAWCAGVGPAALYAPPVAASDTAADDAVREVAVVAWNMAAGRGDIVRFLADLRLGVHTGGVPPRHFVLLLQEVPRLGDPVPPAHRLPDGVRFSAPDPVHGPGPVELARAARLHLLYVPSMREGRGEDVAVDHGTAILSSLPLADVRAIELPAGIQRRVATVARLGGVPASLHVVSVHLDNFGLRHPAGSFGAIRGRQARALARALPADGALVLGGDLNTWARGTREPAFRVLRERLPRPATPQPDATARRLGVPRRLDYLLLAAPPEWDFAEARIDDRYGSDHHPLIGRLRLPAEQPTR